VYRTCAQQNSGGIVADRRVKVVFSAEIQNFKSSMEAAAQATSKAKTASDDAGKAADKSATEIQKQGLAHIAAAKAAGLQYDNTGQLVTMNGKAVTSQQAAAHGLQTFSQEAYLAGRAAVSAGEDAEKAAKVAVAAEMKAAEAAKRHKEALEEVGRVAAIGGAIVLAGVGMAVKSYADFDKQMSSVDAATHETAGNMALLRQAAVDAGADTAFSAVDAARGIEEMAKAGVSTKDILAGGLSGALALAAAGSLDVGTAAELASSALTQFKLKGSDLPHVADLLAAGAGKAQGSVEDLGAALNQSGLIAAQTGLTLEETTGGLAAFASAGLTGSDAGTSFKTMLGALTPNSAAAATAMSELGISAYDSQGKFIGLSEFAGNLKESLSGLTDEQRNSTLETIFGSDAVRAASVLYEQGSAGVQKWEDAVNDAGFAADTAARMQDNLAGDLEKLGGSFDTALIQSGSGANEVLRGLVQNLEGVVDAVGKVPAPVLGAVTGIAALVGGAALIGGTLITVIPKIRDTRDALNELAPAGGKARSALDKVSGAATGLAALGTATLILAKLAEADYMSKIDVGMGKVADALADVTTNSPGAAKSLDSLFQDRDGGKLIQGVENLNTAMQRTFNKNKDQEFNDWAEGIINGMTGVKGSSQILGDAFGRVDKTLADMVAGGKAEDAAKSFDKIEAAAKIQGATVEEVAAKFPEYADALKAAEAAAKTAAVEGDKAAGAIEGVGGAAKEAGPSAEDLAKQLEDVGLRADGSVENLDKFTQALVNAGLLTLSSRDATAKFDEALDGLDGKVREIMATEQAHGGVLNEGKTDLDLYSEAGRAANDVLADMTQKGIGAAEAMAKNGASMPEVQGQLGKTYDAMVLTAKGFGLGQEESEALTRSILHIPPGVDIKTWMSDEAKRMAERTKKAIDDIPPRKDIGIYTTEYFDTLDRRSEAAVSDPNKLGGHYAVGGRLRGFADGGKMPSTGPGTEVRDGFLGISSAGVPLARVDKDEWIINGPSSNKYNRELAAINAGTFPKLPGYANGSRAGREYSAQSLGYSPTRAVAVASAPMQMTGTLTMDSGEVLGVFRGVATQVAQAELSGASRGSSYQRGGHQ
jgi:TP901 family phage tail tape measure protein